MRFLAVLLGAVWLTACFASQNPLISEAEAVFPIEPGVYARQEPGEDAAGNPVSREVWRGALRLENGVYDIDDPDSDFTAMRIARLHDGAFIAQSPLNNDAGWIYLLLYVYPNGDFGLVLPDCSLLGEEEVAGLGLARDGMGLCETEDAAAMREAVMLAERRAAEGGEPVEFASFFRRIE